MDNPEEVLHILDEFAKLKPKDIPKELEDYLSYVARTGDPVYQWSLVKCLFREKLLRVITDFYESTPLLNPPSPAGDNFNYEAMKRVLLERLETFSNAPFTVQRLCELLTAPRKQYNRTDKFMRAIEKNILVVSTREPGSACRQENALSEPLSNGVADGESLSQGVNNDTLHIGSEAHSLSQNEDSIAVENSLSEENHVDIGSNEAEIPKEFDPINVELTNSSDEAAGDKLVSDTGAELEDESCVKQVDSEAHSSLVHQAEIIENIEPIVRTDCVESLAQSLDVEHIDSTEGTSSIDQAENELSDHLVNQEELKIEDEQIDSHKEGVLTSENEIVCDSGVDEEKGEEVSEECNEAAEKTFVTDSDVSCSSSDTIEWSNAEAEETVTEPECVSTSESVLVASSSELAQSSELVEEAVDTSSSDEPKSNLVQPESTDSLESSNEKADTAILDVLENIDSSSHSVLQPQNDVKEEDAVGTTDIVDTTDIITENSEENVEDAEDESSVAVEAQQLEVKSEETNEAATVQGSAVVDEVISEPDTKEVDVEVSVAVPEEGDFEPKSNDVCDASTPSTISETLKEATPAVSDEAMDVDEANSCHSTEPITEGDEMTVADQSEPMDDSE